MATNVAAAANGGTATASSNAGAGYVASFAINGDRIGSVWGTNGGWADGTPSVYDDWLQVDFNASYSINEIDVFTLQDTFTPTLPPTLAMTSSLYGVRDFDVEYWTGSAWATVPGGAITGNSHVWVQLSFSPVMTTKIRVLCHDTMDGYSRVVELEAWTAPSAPSTPNTPSPATTSTGISLSPTLTWLASGATLFDVYFGTAASPPLVNANQVAATYQPVGLAGSTVYFWKIVAKNDGGSTTGSVWSFTTLSASAVTSLKPVPMVEVELSGVNGGWTNISRDVLRDYEISIHHGIDGTGPKDLVASSGTGRFALNNSASNSAGLLGYYSLYHANKRSGWALGINCRIRLQDPNTGTYYTRFIGRIDAIDPAPGVKGARSVTVVVTDWMDEAARWNLTPDIGEQVEKRWDEILTSILAEMPRQPTATSFDSGVEAYPYALDTSSSSTQAALSEFVKLASSEFGLIYQKADGTFRAEGRHSRLLDTVSDWTITDIALQDLRLPSTRDEIINVVRVTVHPKVVDELPTTLIYDQVNVIEVAGGATKMLLGPYRDPITGDPIGATDVQPQISGTDFIANTSEDGTGTDVTASVTAVLTAGSSGAKIEVTNSTANTAFVTRNVLYGRAIYDRGTMQFEARDSVSVNAIGEHSVEFDMPYQDDDDVGQGAANYILNKYSSAFAQARSITVVATSATLLGHVLARDISDRLSISETVTGLNSTYFINGVDLLVTLSGHVEAKYTLAPAADPSSGLYWILGTSTLGTDTIPAPF